MDVQDTLGLAADGLETRAEGFRVWGFRGLGFRVYGSDLFRGGLGRVCRRLL